MNSALVDQITQKLTAGGVLQHPGNPDTNQPPVNIPTPFKSAGQPPEYARAVNATAKLFVETVLHMIETEADGTIINRTELDQLRAADQQPGMPVPIVCRNCNTDLFHAEMVNGRIRLDGRALSALKHQCGVHVAPEPALGYVDGYT